MTYHQDLSAEEEALDAVLIAVTDFRRRGEMLQALGLVRPADNLDAIADVLEGWGLALTRVDEVDPRLVRQLDALGEEFGPLGVARTALARFRP